MKNPAVSIVMSVCNEKELVSRAIDSCLNQTFRDFELIIIDDGSTDGTDLILSAYKAMDDRVVIISQENKGLAVSLNLGVSLSRGEFIARMDGDDVSLPTRLQKQIEYLNLNPDIDVLGTAAYLRSREGEDLGVVVKQQDHESLVRLMHMESPFIHPSVVIRRDVIITAGGYSEKVLRAQDYELWSRLFKVCNFHNLQEPLLIYTVSGQLRVISILRAARVRLLVGWRIGRPVSAALRVVINVLSGVLTVVGLRKSSEIRGKYRIQENSNTKYLK